MADDTQEQPFEAIPTEVAPVDGATPFENRDVAQAGETAPASATDQLDALEISRAVEGLMLGGPVVLVLLALSVFALALILAKFLQFASAKPSRVREIDAAIAHFRDGRFAEAREQSRRAKGVVAEPVSIAINGLIDGRSPTQVRADALRVATEKVEALRGWMRPLEVIASLAPLLGLFGTVLGMIAAFAALEAAGSQVDPAILSGGIWEALLTTAVGLAVAIPTVAAVNWFERQIERCAHRLECALSAVFAAAPLEPPAAQRDRFTVAAAAE